MRLPLLISAMVAVTGASWLALRPGAAMPSGGADATAALPSLPAEPAPQAAAVAACAGVRFVPNRGQWAEEVRYVALGDNVAWLHDDGFTVRFARHAASRDGRELAEQGQEPSVGAVMRTRFAGTAARARAEQRLAGVYNFLRGADSERWRTAVPAFGRVLLESVHPGIDVVFRTPDSGQGVFEYDLLLARGAELSTFVARCEGAEALRIDDAGRLCITVPTPAGAVELVQDRPVAWQQTPTGPRPLTVDFRLVGDDGYGFRAIARDPDLATVVDPGVAWSTYLGGGASDRIAEVAFRPGVGIWLGGWAGSLDFPTTTGAYQATGERDGFVARLDVNGSALQYATYFGGSAGDEVRGLALGPGLTPTVVGFTASADLPTTALAHQPIFGGASPVVPIGDAFVARLSAAGDALLSSTYIGGIADDVAEAVAVDGQGYAHVTGWASSPDLPTTPGSFQPALGGAFTLQSDGFVARIAPDGSAAWCTYLGGGLNDQLRDVAVVPGSGDVVVVGWSTSVGYPTTPLAYHTTNASSLDMVVTRLAASGSSLIWSTFLGGLDEEGANGVALAADESVWIAGWTDSTNYPVSPNALQSALAGETDVAIGRLAANGQSLDYSTLLGGTDSDQARDIAIDGDELIIVGEAGAGFPVTPGAAQATFGGGVLDAFVTHLTANGTTLEYSTYFGGSGHTDALISVGFASGLVVAGGWSFAADFPVTTAALQTQKLGASDGVVMMIDLLTDLGGGLAVLPSPAVAPRYIEAGEHEVLVVMAENRSPRTLTVDAMRVLIAGAGHAPAQVGSVTVWLDDPALAGERDLLVGGPLTPTNDDAELELPLTGATVAAGEVLTLRVVAQLTADQTGSTIEVACVTTGPDAWTLSAFGAGGGPTVTMHGGGRAVGPVLIAGAQPGDGDGDGAYTVFDLRLLCTRFGANDRQVDADGDQVITSADVDLVRSAVLDQPSLVFAPATMARGQWVTITGVFPHLGLADASLGGSSLRIGGVTPRELTLFVGPLQPTGSQTLTVYVGGVLIVADTVLVQ